MKKSLISKVSICLIAALLGSVSVTQGVSVPNPSIVDVAIAVNAETGEFSVLIEALLAADPAILDRLSSRGQSTVFAPTDEAFASLLEELGISAEELLDDSELLSEVLLYHVVPGRRDAESVVDSTRLRTLQRGFLHQEGGVLTDAQGRTANIIATDIEAVNGIIHVIDGVVRP